MVVFLSLSLSLERERGENCKEEMVSSRSSPCTWKSECNVVVGDSKPIEGL
jgi:hypothetical protein